MVPKSAVPKVTTANVSREEAATWLGMREATELIGCNYTQIRKFVVEGTIRKAVDLDGRVRYNPDDCREAAEIYEPEEKQVNGLTPEDFKAGNELVKQVHSHHATMVPLLVDGFQAALQAAEARVTSMSQELVAKDQRIAALEKERDENAARRAQELNDEHMRILATKSLESAERRKDKAFGVFTDQLAPILMNKFGINLDPKAAAGLKFLQTVKREQVLGLLAVGMLEPGQSELALKLIEPLTEEERSELIKAGAIPSEPSNGAATTKEN